MMTPAAVMFQSCSCNLRRTDCRDHFFSLARPDAPHQKVQRGDFQMSLKLILGNKNYSVPVAAPVDCDAQCWRRSRKR